MKSPLFAVGLLLLTGCSTLSEQDCRQADWFQIGVRDGRFGEPAALLQQHQTACDRYAVVDGAAYEAGRVQGLQDYCKLENALRLGLNGLRYKGTCPAEVDMRFNRYNSTALTVYSLRQQLAECQGRIGHQENKMLIGRDSLKARSELRILQRERERLQTELQLQQRELEQMMQEARSLSAKP